MQMLCRLRRWLRGLEPRVRGHMDRPWLLRLQPWLEQRALFRFQRQPLARGVAAGMFCGLIPGPLLFVEHAPVAWAIIASLCVGNAILLILNLPLVGLWVKLLKIPKPPLYAGILIFATVGVYGMRQSAFDLVLLYGIGVLGVVMRRFSFPTAPVVVGLILGPLAEAQMRNAVAIGEGRWTIFLQRPGSLALLLVIAAVLVLPRAVRWLRRPALG